MSGEETGRPGMVMGRAGMTCPGRSLKILKGGDDERGPIGAAVHCCLRSSLRAGASGRRQILSFERVGMYHRAAGPGAAWVRFNATNGSLVGRKKRRWTEAGFERARGRHGAGRAGGKKKKKKKTERVGSERNPNRRLLGREPVAFRPAGRGFGVVPRALTLFDAAVAAASHTKEKNAASLTHRLTSWSLGGAAPVALTPARK